MATERMIVGKITSKKECGFYEYLRTQFSEMPSDHIKWKAEQKACHRREGGNTITFENEDSTHFKANI